MTTPSIPRGGKLAFKSEDNSGQESRIEIAPDGAKILYHGPVQSQRWLDMNFEARAAYREGIAKHLFTIADEHKVDEWEIFDENEDVRAYAYC